MTSTITSILTFSNMTALAPLIQLNWKSSDLRALSSAAVESSGSATPRQTVVETTPLATSASSSGGLSTGGKAAIGVVVALVVLASIAILTLLLRRRKGSLDKRGLLQPQYQDKPELDASSVPKLAFMKSTVPAELSVSDQPQELEPEVRHELAVPDVTHELATSERGSFGQSDGISERS